MIFLNQLLKGVFHAITTDKNNLLITWGDGFGDSLLLSSVAYEWKVRTGKKVAIYTKFPDLYRENPDVIIYPYMQNLIFPFKTRITKDIHFPIYAQWTPENDFSMPPDKHIIAKMCEFVGIHNTIHLRPYFHLSEKEMETNFKYRNLILIQTSVSSARLPMKNKEWYPSRFQEIVNVLCQNYHFIQVGSLQDPPLQNVTDFRGKTSIRQLACLMRQSQLFIGLVGFLMHLARANECPSVIVYGGREHPHQSGYLCNQNIASYISCAPCWLWNRCAYDRKCMADITVQQVLEAAHRQLQSRSKPLEVEKFIL